MPKKVRTEERQSRTHMAMPNLPATKPMGSNPPQQRVPHPKLAVLISVLVILYVALNIWIYLYGRDAVGGILGNLLKTVSIVKTQRSSFSPRATPSLTPTPTPIKLTPGKGTYKVGQGKHDGPTISTISFDPLDVTKGQTLTITVEVAAKTPAQNVSATLQSDHKDQSLQFTQSSAAGGAASLWTATITMDDTVWYKYLLDVTATAGINKSNVIVTPR